MTTPDSAPTPEILRARMVSRWMGLIEEAYQSRDDILTSAGYTPRSLGLNFVADQIRAEVERLAAQSVPFKREDLTLAAVNCQHQIDADCVRLWRDETREGSALSQLVDRVVAVVAQSVSADTGGEEVRMLTKEESRAAMGFPDTYRIPDNHKDAMHMLGNAVVPPVARDIINALRKAA